MYLGTKRFYANILKNVHAVVFNEIDGRKTPSAIHDNDNACIYPFCRYIVDDREAYMQHLVTEHNMLGLHITDSHVPRDHLHTQDPGPSPSMSVETTPELLDMDVGDLRGDVAQMGSVDHVATTPELLDVDVGDLRGDVAQMGPVYTYEDAGPSTKRLTPPRKRRRIIRDDEDDTDLDTAIHTPTPSSPVSRKEKEKAVSSPLSVEMLTSAQNPELHKEIEENEDQFIFGTNTHVTEGLQDEFRDNQILNRTFASLKAIPNAWDLLERILSATVPSEASSRCMPLIDQTSHNSKFLLVMQLTMIDFCVMWFTEIDRFHAVNPELPSWHESIIPMFKFFSRMTHLVDFKWCGTPTASQALGMVPIIPSAPVVDVDGLGTTRYKATLLMDSSRVLIPRAAEVLQFELAKHQKYSFSTYLKLKVLTLNTGNNVLTLSSVSFTQQKKYKVMELRTAVIPLGWEQRILWFHMFDLLAHIMELLLEQETVHKQLLEERDGGGVLPEDTIQLE